MRVEALLAGLAAVLLAGCSSGGGTSVASRPASPAPPGSPAAQATESNPPGDIPDDTVFVPYRPGSGLYEIRVPEGWARIDNPTGATFTDKLNSIRTDVVATVQPPSANRELPQIQATTPKFKLTKVETLTRRGGQAVRIVYQADSAADPVTGKVVRDEVERYEFYKGGQEAVLTLSGPSGADNVDPWRTVSDSFRWLR